MEMSLPIAGYRLPSFLIHRLHRFSPIKNEKICEHLRVVVIFEVIE